MTAPNFNFRRVILLRMILMKKGRSQLFMKGQNNY